MNYCITLEPSWSRNMRTFQKINHIYPCYWEYSWFEQMKGITLSALYPKQAMTEAGFFTIGRSRTIGYGKIRPLADYRSRSRLLNLKSTWLNCILFVVYVLYVTHNLTKGWGLGLNHFKFLHDLVKNWLPFLMPSFF